MLDEQGRENLMDELRARMTPVFNNVEAADAISCMLVGSIGLVRTAYGCDTDNAIACLMSILDSWKGHDLDGLEPKGNA